MKNFYITALACLSLNAVNAQAPSISLNHVYSQYPTVEYGSSIDKTIDGGYIVGSVSASNGYVFKIDGAGNLDWDMYIPNDTVTGITTLYDIHQTSDGGYIVAGTDYAFQPDSIGSHGIRDFMLMKLDQNGTIIWIKAYGGTANEEAYSITQTADGGYFAVGYTTSNDGDLNGNPVPWYSEAWILKVDGSGTIQWQKAYGGGNYDYATSVKATADGGAIVGGYSQSKDGNVAGTHWGGSDEDYWVMKLDASGSITWQNSYGGSGGDILWSVETDSDGGYILAGTSGSHDGLVTGNHDTSGGIGDFWVVKINSSGTMQWQKSLGGNGTDIAYAVKPTVDNGYIITGTVAPSTSGDITGFHGTGGTDFWAVKLDNSGTLVWQIALGGTGQEDARDIVEAADGGYTMVGTELSPNGDVNYTTEVNYSHIWVVKLGGNGTAGILENGWSDLSVYPNPARETVTIEELSAGDNVIVEDMNGRIVYTGSAATNSMTLNVVDFQKGMYVLTVISSANEQNKKLIIE